LYCAKCEELLQPEDRHKLNRLKILAFLIIPYLQAIMYYGSKYHPLLEIENSAGEMEHDRKSQRFNLIEVIGLYLLAQFAMWFLIGFCGMDLNIAILGDLGYGLLGLLIIWAIFLSPYYHSDTWHGVGFSRPLEVFSLLKSGNQKQKIQLWLTIIGVGIVMMIILSPDWGLVLTRFGLRGSDRDLYTELTTGTEGIVFTLLFVIVVYIILILILVRWDNFWSICRKIILFAVLFWLGIVLLGVIYSLIENNWDKFTSFVFWSDSDDSFIPHSGFYLLWGMIQQWLCMGYFNTRLRKGFVNKKYGPFSGRILTSLLSGAFFAGIHIPAGPLMVVTFIGGFFFGWFFQKDEYRNLFIMGLAHGVGGTLLGMLTPVVMEVGPWHV
jgi:hypothetical protein